MFKIERIEKVKGSIMNWYLLQIKPNGYEIAKKHLCQQGFEVFLPLIIKTTKIGIKFINRQKPLFPGYLFLGTALDDIPWKSVNATRGVSKAITLDGHYRAIPAEIVLTIKSRCDQNDVLLLMDNIAAGDRVKIEKGPFSDFICNVEKIDDRKRAWVLIEILQQQTRTAVSLGDLLKVN